MRTLLFPMYGASFYLVTKDGLQKVSNPLKTEDDDFADYLLETNKEYCLEIGENKASRKKKGEV